MNSKYKLFYSWNSVSLEIIRTVKMYSMEEEVQMYDITSMPEHEIIEMLRFSEYGLDEILEKRSQLYKSKKEEIREECTISEIMAILYESPRLIKGPFIAVGNCIEYVRSIEEAMEILRIKN